MLGSINYRPRYSKNGKLGVSEVDLGFEVKPITNFVVQTRLPFVVHTTFPFVV